MSPSLGSLKQGRDSRGQEGPGVKTETPSTSPCFCEPEPSPWGHWTHSRDGRQWTEVRAKGGKDTCGSRCLVERWTTGGMEDSVVPATTSPSPHLTKDKLRGTTWLRPPGTEDTGPEQGGCMPPAGREAGRGGSRNQEDEPLRTVQGPRRAVETSKHKCPQLWRQFQPCPPQGPASLAPSTPRALSRRGQQPPSAGANPVHSRALCSWHRAGHGQISPHPCSKQGEMYKRRAGKETLSGIRGPALTHSGLRATHALPGCALQSHWGTRRCTGSAAFSHTACDSQSLQQKPN